MEEKKEDFLKRFGEHIIKLRQSKGISGAELARQCDMDKPNITRLEKGKINPSLMVLKKISLGLGIKLEELLKDFD